MKIFCVFRDSFVADLSKYIDVDIFGSCGSRGCPGRRSNECYQYLERNYRFYLSFENSLCRDYVTEKAFHPLKYNLIPITFGSALYRCRQNVSERMAT